MGKTSTRCLIRAQGVYMYMSMPLNVLNIISGNQDNIVHVHVA